MTYKQTLDYLFSSTPVFEKQGTSAYKPGFGNSMALDGHLMRPHRSYRSIHVGGTNGKGSVSHTLASVLQSAGYNVGLYTSPHLVDFCERIRVNGKKVDEDFVVSFVERHSSFFEPLNPSFFEIITAMAFDYFRLMKVDIAVIEVGLGGRLDCTNIISPILSLITNISKDHTDLLGNSLAEIAFEKAGIIKENVPVVVGQANEEVRNVFIAKAEQQRSPVFFANSDLIKSSTPKEQGWKFDSSDFGTLESAIAGSPQEENNLTILAALRVLKDLLPGRITKQAVAEGFKNVIKTTGLQGRWQTLCSRPQVVADIAHNTGAWAWNCRKLNEIMPTVKGKMRVVLGFSGDKDVDEILAMLPKEANYIFTNAASERALPADKLKEKAAKAGLEGVCCNSVYGAIQKTVEHSAVDDFILISGSNFVVAEAIPYFDNYKTNK